MAKTSESEMRVTLKFWESKALNAPIGSPERLEAIQHVNYLFDMITALLACRALKEGGQAKKAEIFDAFKFLILTTNPRSRRLYCGLWKGGVMTHDLEYINTGMFTLLKERHQMKNRDELEECLEIALNALRCGEPDKCQAHVEKAYDLMVYGLKPELEPKS